MLLLIIDIDDVMKMDAKLDHTVSEVDSFVELRRFVKEISVPLGSFYKNMDVELFVRKYKGLLPLRFDVCFWYMIFISGCC